MIMTTFTIEFAKQFKLPYSYKMGGTQTVVMPNGERFEFNDKETYSGRGAKYNSSINYHIIGDIVVSKKQVSAAIKIQKEREKRIKIVQKENKAEIKRIENAKKAGIYSVKLSEYGNYIELSQEEIYGNFFDEKRLAETLKISIEDADLLNSEGKTYVFAKSEDGNTYELYHPSLQCNHLSISFNIATAERIAKFKPENWQSAPYADMVGQSSKNNHFVC